MNYPQSFEEIYQEELHVFQSYPFLSIFPIRNQQIQLTPKAQQAIFKYLACTLCGELMNIPVYLPCAHRFCKNCIEQHIRSTSNKTCPFCRNDEILSKKDLRIDDFIIDLASILFQDIQINSISANVKEEKESTLQNSSDQVKFQQSIEELSTCQMVMNVSRKRNRGNKQARFLWNQSNEKTQQRERIDQQFEQPKSRKKSILNNNPSLDKADSKQSLINNNYPQQISIKQYYSNDLPAKKQAIVESHSQSEIDILKLEYSNQYGKNYFTRLAEITQREVFLTIRLLPNPYKPLTPSLKSQLLLCPHHILAVSIERFIALELNVSWRNIRLRVKIKSTMKQIYGFTKISKINQRYWSNNSFNALNLCQMLKQISFQDHASNEHNGEERVLYYEIEFQKKQHRNEIKKAQI